MRGGKRVWVHIGLPKCGSTSIQRYFAEHYDHYMRYGLCYPKAHRSLGGHHSHLPIARANSSDLPKIVQDISSEAREASNILISCEDFSNSLPEGQAKNLVKQLNRAFGAESVFVISYFRNVYQFVESSFAQFILGGLFRINRGEFFSTGAPPSIGKFLDVFARSKDFPLYSLSEYAKLIRGSFPENRVILKSIESNDLQNSGLVEDLCQMIGVDPLQRIGVQNKRISNQKLAMFLYAQSIVSQSEFNLAQHQLRKLDVPTQIAKNPLPFRNKDICLDVELHNLVKECISTEISALRELFASGVEGLCEDRWTPLVSRSELNDYDRRYVRELLRSCLG